MTLPRLILAPLLGVTTASFRTIVAQSFPGFSDALAPFITTTKGNPAALSHFRDVHPDRNRGGLPLIPQLIGKDGHDFITAANRLHTEFGYAHINWNIGCPAPTVTAKARGAGLLPHPDLIDAFLDTVFSHTQNYAVSLKMRLGYASTKESEALIPILNRYPLCEVTVHARTAAQQYSGMVNLDAFKILYNGLTVPLIYNGDITSTGFARSILEQFPRLAGLMIGRGAIADPTLPGRINGALPDTGALSPDDLERFHNTLFSTYQSLMEGGPTPILGRMKELWRYFSIHWGHDNRCIKKVLKASTIADFQSAADYAFSILKKM